jgi:DNA-binding NarL/FixJ family response regulator
MKNFLSTEERENLKAQHKKERDKRVCYRINAVLLADMGWSNQQIAEALFLSDESIRQHIILHITQNLLMDGFKKVYAKKFQPIPAVNVLMYQVP